MATRASMFKAPWPVSLTVLISLGPFNFKFCVVLDTWTPLFVNLDPLTLKVITNPGGYFLRCVTKHTFGRKRLNKYLPETFTILIALYIYKYTQKYYFVYVLTPAINLKIFQHFNISDSWVNPVAITSYSIN